MTPRIKTSYLDLVIGVVAWLLVIGVIAALFTLLDTLI